MDTMNRLAILALSTLLVATPLAMAGHKAPKECVLDAAQWGGPIVAESTSAENQISLGIKPIGDNLMIGSDIGFIGPAFAVFELPQFKEPALFGKLRIQIETASTAAGVAPDLTVALFDITDLPLLLQPFWTLEEYEASKADLASGRVYGEFSVRKSPLDDGRILDVPLSYDAMFDINAAAGGAFAIGFANGEGWELEGDGVNFLDPPEGGVIQLIIPYCK
jgi:hypothetical protein